MITTAWGLPTLLCFYRVVKLALSNQALRQQLEESQNTNSRLTDDVDQLTIKLKENQLKLKDSEDVWRENFQKEAHSSASSHQLSLAVAMRDVSRVKSDLSTLGNAVKR